MLLSFLFKKVTYWTVRAVVSTKSDEMRVPVAISITSLSLARRTLISAIPSPTFASTMSVQTTNNISKCIDLNKDI